MAIVVVVVVVVGNSSLVCGVGSGRNGHLQQARHSGKGPIGMGFEIHGDAMSIL